ncbi:MAG: RNA polymerase subunit sigma-70 [Candidatus Hydrogenedentota bacterium]|nr:MAG: RNA polymerase subunit sigma-70 [Candidatus Hydrogenedentota bacterium]
MHDLNDSDEALATRFRDGDSAAFDVLVHRYQARVVAVAYRLTGNREEALDVAQEAFIKAYRKINMWKPSGSFRSWLFRITANQAIDAQRKRSRRREIHSEAEVLGKSVPRESKAVEQISESERAESIRAALETLSPKQRQVFVLKHYEDFTLAEIAETLDVSIGSVKVHLFRAVRKLRDELQDSLGELK